MKPKILTKNTKEIIYFSVGNKYNGNLKILVTIYNSECIKKDTNTPHFKHYHVRMQFGRF